jgi:hypothetical protein
LFKITKETQNKADVILEYVVSLIVDHSEEIKGQKSITYAHGEV